MSIRSKNSSELADSKNCRNCSSVSAARLKLTFARFGVLGQAKLSSFTRKASRLLNS